MLGIALVADLAQQPVLMSSYLQIARVQHLGGVFLNFVVVGCEPFEDDDEVARVLSDFDVEETFSLHPALGAEVVLHEILDIDLVFDLVEDASFLELQLDYRKLLLLQAGGYTLILC